MIIDGVNYRDKNQRSLENKKKLPQRDPCALNVFAIFNSAYEFLSCEVIIPLYLTRSQLLN